jgi:hypothetical protein
MTLTAAYSSSNFGSADPEHHSHHYLIPSISPLCRTRLAIRTQAIHFTFTVSILWPARTLRTLLPGSKGTRFQVNHVSPLHLHPSLLTILRYPNPSGSHRQHPGRQVPGPPDTGLSYLWHHVPACYTGGCAACSNCKRRRYA